MNFWEVVGLFFWSFAFVAYLFVLFAILTDLFRDHSTNGWVKALWIILLVFVPFLTALIYLIARGSGMA
ncbi:MAG: PLDc N-terminal domain-containing protein, partial [Microterricola sp.]